MACITAVFCGALGFVHVGIYSVRGVYLQKV
jgi:hypothetical protein